MEVLLKLCIVFIYALYNSNCDNVTQSPLQCIEFPKSQIVKKKPDSSFFAKNLVLGGTEPELDVSDPLISPFCDDELFYDGIFWYVRDKSGVPDRIIRRGEARLLNTHIMFGQSENGRWCKFLNTSEEFKLYLNSMPLITDYEDTTYDNYRLSERSDEKVWLVRDDMGLFKKILLQGDSRYNKQGTYYIRCDNDIWYKLKRPPGEFLSYLAKIPELEQTHLSDELLAKKRDGWYVLNRFGNWKKVTHQNLRNSTFRYRYARDEDGTWCKFFDPPSEFMDYLDSLPLLFRPSSNEMLKLSEDGTEWMICSKNGPPKKIRYRDPKHFQVYDDMLYRAYDEDGRWHTFINPSTKFVEWMSHLPVSMKGPQTWDNMRLIKGEGNEWNVKDGSGNARKIDARGEKVGEHTANRIFYARTDNGKWFKFRNPPKLFVDYLFTKPVIPRDTLWDDRLKNDEHSWFVLDEDGKQRKIICQNARNSPASRYKYACDINGTWFKFQNPPDEFMQYMLKLPGITAQYDNNRLKLSDDGKMLWIYSKVNGELKKLKEKRLIMNIKSTGLNVVQLCDEDFLWYNFASPPKPIFDWIANNLPETKERSKCWDNYRLVQDEEMVNEWKVRDSNGTLRTIDTQGDTIHHEREVYYVGCGKDWFKLKQPPKQFIRFLSGLPIVTQSPLADNLVQKCGKFWYVINKNGEKRKIITRNHRRTREMHYTYAKDEDGIWYKFHNAPPEFMTYLEILPRAWTGTDNGRLIMSEEGNEWSVRQKYGVLKKLVYRGVTRTTKGVVTQVAYDDDSNYYYFIDPPLRFIEFALSLPEKS